MLRPASNDMFLISRYANDVGANAGHQQIARTPLA